MEKKEERTLSNCESEHIKEFLRKKWFQEAENLALNLIEPEKTKALYYIAKFYLGLNLYEEALRIAKKIQLEEVKNKIVKKAVENAIDLGFYQDAYEIAELLPTEKREAFNWIKLGSEI